MPEKLFIDTGAFFALKCATDMHHADAVEIYDQIVSKREYVPITTNLVIFETATLIKARLGNDPAIEFAKTIRQTPFVSILRVSEELENEAWRIFENHTDKDYSFIDCASFAFMKAHNIIKSFSFDKHFEQAGFIVLPL